MMSKLIYPELKICKLTESATTPTRGSSGSAGMDLYFDITSQAKSEHIKDTSATIYPGSRKILKTGISMMIPRGYYGQIAPRSGLAVKHGIEVLAGIIDSDYRGEIMVALLNSGDEPVSFAHGDRIAQMIIIPYLHVAPKVVDSLDETERGSGGFGSTGA